MSQAELSQTLTDQRECDREAIHLFTSIQSRGVLIGFSWNDHRIQVVSENIHTVTGSSIKEALGSRLEYIFEKAFIQNLTYHVDSYPWKSYGRHLQIRPQVNGKTYDAYLFHSDGLFILELEEYRVQNGSGQIDTDIENELILKEYMLKSKECKTVVELSQLVCTTFRRMTGLDRVMMYRFMAPTWHGEVIAEDRVTHSHAYLGHRFPASDIPRPARQLYLQNQVRLISDVTSDPVALVPQLNPLSKKVLDLSDSRLRSVAKVHIEYLKNMEVGASFSVAVTDQNELWGLITCHHLKPIHISQSQRTTCEIIAHSFSIQAVMLERVEEQARRLDFEMKLKKILESLRLSREPLDSFFKQHQSVTEAFDAIGIALVGQKLQDLAGMTPLKANIEELAVWLRERMATEHQTVLAIDDLPVLSERWSSIKEFTAGVLAIKLSDINDSLLLLFRPEVVRTIIWGGDPRKQLEARNFQGTINPRASFEAWEEVIKNRSIPWSRHEVDGIMFLKDFVFDGLVQKEHLIKELSQRASTR